MPTKLTKSRRKNRKISADPINERGLPPTRFQGTPTTPGIHYLYAASEYYQYFYCHYSYTIIPTKDAATGNGNPIANDGVMVVANDAATTVAAIIATIVAVVVDVVGWKVFIAAAGVFLSVLGCDIAVVLLIAFLEVSWSVFAGADRGASLCACARVFAGVCVCGSVVLCLSTRV